jgi:methylmalonyl-CoA carboxyltransferase large subunit
MGAEGAAEIVFRREIAEAEDPAARGLVDDIICPERTREMVSRALEMLVAKRDLRPAKKHGLGPT